MKNKIKKISAIIALMLTCIMMLSIAVSSLPSLTPVEAYDPSTGKYSGREDAEDLSDFNNDITIQNKFKLWSIFKSMGMTDNQAVAAIACSIAESGGGRSEIIEGNDNAGLGISLGTTLEQSIAYIDAYSKYIDTDADKRTQFTDNIMRAYGVEESYITNAHNGIRGSAPVHGDFNFDSVSLDTYYDEAGVGWLGVGIFGFTGSSLKKLFVWCDVFDARWYEFDYQIAYFISSSPEGYKGCAQLENWIAESKDYDLNQCVETFFHAMINGNELADMVADRQESANAIYDDFAGLEWDKVYGKKVLGIAGLTPIDLGSGIRDKSIIYSYASTVAYYPRNNGYLVNMAENDDLAERNKEVFIGHVKGLKGETDDSTTYSLFELYGEDLHWYRYFGESTYTPNLLDHVWSAIDQDKTKELISFDTIDWEADTYLSCNVYPDRPVVLTKEDIKNGDRDPRVLALSNGWFNGFFYVQGSLKMAAAKYFVAIVSILTGPEIQNVVVDLINMLETTEFWNTFKVILMCVCGLAMILFIVSIVIKAVKYSKGQGAARDAIGRFLIGFFCLGLLFAGLARPQSLNNTVLKVVNLVDTLFTASLADTISNDEVIAVQNPNLAVHAVLWKKAIFNPWCRGQFDNLEYNELYTAYATLDSGQSVMPQSHEEVDPNDQIGTAFYDSVTCTGDVFVPVGGGKEIRNWAAYLYSCGTIYHIDSTLDDKAADNIDTENGYITFPHYTLKTTANDSTIAADLFRIIDAQMNISPQYYANGSTNNNYQDSNGLDPHYEWQSTIMLFNAALLLFMMPVIFSKLMNFILLYITIFKMIFFTIMELFKEDAGFKPFFDSIKKHFVNYFTACLKLNLMILLYYILVDKGFVELVLYVACSIVILGFSWKDVQDGYYRAKNNVERVKRQF